VNKVILECVWGVCKVKHLQERALNGLLKKYKALQFDFLAKGNSRHFNV
jgi:hypothetical protein